MDIEYFPYSNVDMIAYNLAVAAVSLDRKLTSLEHSSNTSSGGSGIRYLYIIVKLVSIKGVE